MPLNARLVLGSSQTELAVRDVSLSGIFLYCETPPGPVGTPVTLELALTAGIKPMLIRGKIVRLVRDPKGKAGDLLGIGVEFGGASPEQEQGLIALLDRAMNGKGTNNRAFPRICYQLEVTCRMKDEVKAVLNDIGEGGVGLTVDRSFTRDEDVTVEIVRASGAPLKLPGWVVSSLPIGAQPGSFRVGVRFGGLGIEARKQLRAFLEGLYRR